MSKIVAKWQDRKFSHVEINVVYNGIDHKTLAIPRTGSDCTIVSCKLLGIEINDKMKSIKAAVGWETVTVYEVEIDRIDLAGTPIDGMNRIYISDLPYFDNESILGMDIPNKYNITFDNDAFTLEQSDTENFDSSESKEKYMNVLNKAPHVSPRTDDVIN